MSARKPKPEPSPELPLPVSQAALDLERTLVALFQMRLRGKAAENASSRRANVVDEADYQSASDSLLNGRSKCLQALGSFLKTVRKLIFR